MKSQNVEFISLYLRHREIIITHIDRDSFNVHLTVNANVGFSDASS